jgi:hypothetical protein
MEIKSEVSDRFKDDARDSLHTFELTFIYFGLHTLGNT